MWMAENCLAKPRHYCMPTAKKFRPKGSTSYLATGCKVGKEPEIGGNGIRALMKCKQTRYLRSQESDMAETGGRQFSQSWPQLDRRAHLHTFPGGHLSRQIAHRPSLTPSP